MGLFSKKSPLDITPEEYREEMEERFRQNEREAAEKYRYDDSNLKAALEEHHRKTGVYCERCWTLLPNSELYCPNCHYVPGHR